LRLPVLQVLIVLAVATAIAAYIFRSQRAKGWLRFVLKLAYAYIIAIIILALFRLWQMYW
jgi:hypothetical protein